MRLDKRCRPGAQSGGVHYERAVDALELLDTRGATGKIVLELPARNS